MRLVLASQSPRRRELLASVGLAAEVRPANADESVWPGEAPEAYVRRVARHKAEAVAVSPGELVLAADTAVVLAGAILGKPADAGDARRMLRALSGRAHGPDLGDVLNLLGRGRCVKRVRDFAAML